MDLFLLVLVIHLEYGEVQAQLVIQKLAFQSEFVVRHSFLVIGRNGLRVARNTAQKAARAVTLRVCCVGHRIGVDLVFQANLGCGLSPGMARISIDPGWEAAGRWHAGIDIAARRRCLLVLGVAAADGESPLVGELVVALEERGVRLGGLVVELSDIQYLSGNCESDVAAQLDIEAGIPEIQTGDPVEGITAPVGHTQLEAVLLPVGRA